MSKTIINLSFNYGNNGNEKYSRVDAKYKVNKRVNMIHDDLTDNNDICMLAVQRICVTRVILIVEMENKAICTEAITKIW